jgi:hypothetical protein
MATFKINDLFVTVRTAEGRWRVDLDRPSAVETVWASATGEGVPYQRKVVAHLIKELRAYCSEMQLLLRRGRARRRVVQKKRTAA